MSPERGGWADTDPVLRTVARAVFSLVLLFALHLLWRGHNLPGGGFIAGLTTSAAMVLYRVAFGRPVTRVNPRALLPWGLGVAGVTALVPLLAGRPLLTSAFGYVTLPVTGEFEWATAFIFDVGVYLVVVGTTVGIVDTLATAAVRGDHGARGEVEEVAHEGARDAHEGEVEP
ncbi:MnhB domain-containing protein [Deinococcus pimensis]|uniref:MnhB domain-containing protein n=1 Tax=Deinococcus pimensis TaxID=309888 RepID=UPI0004B75AFC|nr:MnhB domain-containing protein [Deinococcus pimensis]